MQRARDQQNFGLLLGVAVFLTVASNHGVAAATTFFDGTFSSPWSDTLISPPTTAGNTVNVITVGSGGFPGAYRQTQHNYSNKSTIIVAHVAPLTLASYTPSTQGSINSIDFSFDGELLPVSPGVTSPDVAYALLIVQNGAYYSAPSGFDSVVTATWAHFSNPGLNAASFTNISGTGPAQPDFSCTAPLIQFGFMTANSSPATAPRAIETLSGIDNWTVTVNTGTPCCTLTGNIVSGCCLGPVPCPGSSSPSDFYSFLASVTLTGAASCTLTVIPSTTGLVIDSFGPVTLVAGANFVTGAFSGPQTGSNFSLSLSCTGAGGLQCSTTLTAPFPACQPISPGNSTGTLTIQKVVDSPVAFTSTMTFPISVTCGGTSTQVPLSNGGSQTVTAPAGTLCTVNEAAPATFISPNCPAGITWLPPTFVPSQTAVISSSLAKVIVVHDEFTCN